MKRFVFILAATLTLWPISGCQKSNPEKDSAEKKTPQEEALPQPGDSVTIMVTLPAMEQVSVKAAITENESGTLMPFWREGEKIKINEELFSINSFEGATGVFAGKVPLSAPYTIEIGEARDGVSTQERSGSISHLTHHAVVSGADDFMEVVMSYGWAAEHGGKFSQSGAFKLNLIFPDNSLTVASVKFETGGINPIELNVGNGALEENAFTAYLPFEAESLILSADSQVTITVTDMDGSVYRLQFYPATQTIQGGHVISLSTQPELWRKITSAGGSIDGWDETDIAG